MIKAFAHWLFFHTHQQELGELGSWVRTEVNKPRPDCFHIVGALKALEILRLLTNQDPPKPLPPPKVMDVPV